MKIAIVKPIKVRIGNLAGLRGIVNYIQDLTKTKNGALVYGQDVFPEKAATQMIITKKSYRKNTGRQYAHFIQSFNRKDELSPEQAFEIGKEFLSRNDKFKGYEVLMAVHTNEAHLHIHYVINSVNHETGAKWQSSKQDLEKMRSISDNLCRENGLSVIENRGNFNMKYGEYKAYKSWKQQLATDIAESIKYSFSVADFYHNLNERGVACDIGEKNIMFGVKEGYCNLNGNRFCSNYRLMPYGDFSRENILNSIDYNDFNRETAITEIHQSGEILAELAGMDIWGGENVDMTALYQSVLQEIEFKGKPWYVIQELIIQLQAERNRRKLAKENLQALQQYNQEQKQPRCNTQILLTSLCGLIEEFTQWRNQRYYGYLHSQNNYYELEDEWELDR